MLQAHGAGHVARDQQPEFVGIRDQAQVEAQVGVDGRGDVGHRFGVAPGGQPVRHRQGLQGGDDRGVLVARMLQAEQGRRGLVEPQHALAVAFDHHHRIRQRGGGGAVGAQHRQQAALARAHLRLAAMQQAVEFVPHAFALRRVDAAARGQAQQQVAQLPVMPGDHAERGGGQRRPWPAEQQADAQPGHQHQRELAKRAEPGVAGFGRHASQSRRCAGRLDHGQGQAAAEKR